MHVGYNIFGAKKYLFGDGTYSGNIIQGGSTIQPVGGVLTLTGAATVAPDALTGASVVMCDQLILDGATASLSPSTNSKGLIVFAKTSVTVRNGARIHINKLGKAGNFGSLNPHDLLPANLKSKISKKKLASYALSSTFVTGGAGGNTSPAVAGGAGTAAGSLQCGGGGGGAGGTYANWGPGGAGGTGGTCCGGSGGGAGGYTTTGTLGGSGAANGGQGGAGGAVSSNYFAGGGAGDPVGLSTGIYAPVQPDGAGGGFLLLASPSISIGVGCSVLSAGATGGGWKTGAGTGLGGGGAGGGCIVLLTEVGGYFNNGTVAAPGGAGGTPTNAPAYGGAGGAGSVNTFTVPVGTK